MYKSPIFIVVTPRGDGGVDFAKPEEEPIERGLVIANTRQRPELQVLNRESGRKPPVTTTAAVSVYKKPLFFNLLHRFKVRFAFFV